MIKKIIEVAACILLFFLTFTMYRGQERVSLNSEHGWDGESYFQAAKQVSEGVFPIVGEPPFVNRIGLHFIVGTYAKVFNKSIITSAMHLNSIAILLTVILLILWLQLFISHLWIRIFLILLYLFVWHSGIRNLFFDTIVPDPWGGVFFLSGILAMHHIKHRFIQNKNLTTHLLFYTLIILVGSLFRESMAAFALSIFFIISPIKVLGLSSIKFREITFSSIKKYFLTLIKLFFNKQSALLFIPLLGVVGAKVIIAYCTSSTDFTHYSYPQALARWFYSKSLPEFLVGTFLSYGPLILLIPFYMKEIKIWLADKEEITFLLFLGLFFGYFGGGDTERILYMSTFPIIFVMLSFALQDLWKNHKLVLGLILVLQSFAYRIYWHLPDCPNSYDQKPIPFFGLLGDKFEHVLIYSTHGNIYINSILFVEYAALFALLFILLKRKTFFKR